MTSRASRALGAIRIAHAAALPLALAAVHLAFRPRYVPDDAYIAFRYARNLANGLGLVYNPGEAVKGYSSTLWTLLMAGAERLSVPPLVAGQAIGGAACLAIVWRVAGRRPLAAVLLALSAPLALWALSGMETVFHAFLLLAGVLRRLDEERDPGRRPLSALWFSLAVLTRPEAILTYLAVAAWDLGARSRRSIRARDVVRLAVPVLVWAGELASSYAYYGDPLPATFYAKVRGSADFASLFAVSGSSILQQLRPSGYLAGSLVVAGGFGMAALGLLAPLRKERRRENVLFAAVVFAQFVFIARVGGDWMPAGRFLVPVLPFLVLLFADALEGAVGALPARLVPAARAGAAAVAVAGFLTASVRVHSDVHPLSPGGAARFKGVADQLAAWAEPGRSIALFDIGRIGYEAPYRILDTSGLTNPGVARARHRDPEAAAAIVLAAEPDVIRRHWSGERRTDEALYRSALASGGYVALDDGIHLIRKDVGGPGGAAGLEALRHAALFRPSGEDLARYAAAVTVAARSAPTAREARFLRDRAYFESGVVVRE